jgi:chromosome segregation ATPase
MKPLAVLIFCIIWLFDLPSGAQDQISMTAKREELGNAYRDVERRLQDAKENMVRLQGDVRLETEALAQHQQHFEESKQQVLKKVQLFFDDTQLTLDTELQAYRAAKQKMRQSEHDLAQHQHVVSQLTHQIKTLEAERHHLDSEQQRLQHAVAEQRFERLREQIER